jgi:prepilin-type processing-associated H-X9-DG protein
MNGWLGVGLRVDGGLRGGAWLSDFYGSHYILYYQDSDVRKLSPAGLWVFIDEHPDFLSTYFTITPSPDYWSSLPASYHEGGCVLGFADGHTEYHQWVVGDTKRPVTASPGSSFTVFTGQFGTTAPSPAPDLRDHDWLFRHSTETVP